MDLERFADGLADCDEALASLPVARVPTICVLVVFFESGDLDKGFAEAAATTRLDPTDAFAYSLTGGAFGRAANLIKRLSRSTRQLNWRSIMACDGLIALANFDRGDYRKASADLRTAIRLGADPSEWSVPLVGKRVTLSDGLGRRIRIRPDMPELYVLRGRCAKRRAIGMAAIADSTQPLGSIRSSAKRTLNAEIFSPRRGKRRTLSPISTRSSASSLEVALGTWDGPISTSGSAGTATRSRIARPRRTCGTGRHW